jgi:hypothetical protein
VIRKIHGCLDSGDAASDDHDSADAIICVDTIAHTIQIIFLDKFLMSNVKTQTPNECQRPNDKIRVFLFELESSGFDLTFGF